MTFLTASLMIASLLLGVSLLLTFVRLYRGPTGADRVVAVDLMLVIAAGIMALAATASGRQAMLDAAVIIAAAAFLGTAAFAEHLERGGKQ